MSSSGSCRQIEKRDTSINFYNDCDHYNSGCTVYTIAWNEQWVLLIGRECS